MDTPAPLRWVERRPRSALHEPRTAALVGIALGVAFTVCFLTGVLSHLIQQPPSWFTWPARPAGFYRISQGLHVICGFVSIPLLLTKLWIVYPKLFEWPPVTSVAQAFERLSLIPLIGGGLFMAMSGTANVARWYPWTFFFPTAHYWVAYVTFGALIIHIGVKWVTMRDHVGKASPSRVDVLVPERRLLLGGLAATSGLVFFAVAGNTIAPLSKLAVLAQRRPGNGPQGMPVNKSAKGAGVADIAEDPSWRLIVEGKVGNPLELSLADLAAMKQRTAELPIACVEGWSTSGTWTGVAVRDLLAMAEAGDDATITVESFQKGGLYRKAEINSSQAKDPDMLLALRLNGEPLHIDHGFPARLIGPNRPGVLQTKWVERLVVS